MKPSRGGTRTVRMWGLFHNDKLASVHKRNVRAKGWVSIYSDFGRNKGWTAQPVTVTYEIKQGKEKRR